MVHKVCEYGCQLSSNDAYINFSNSNEVNVQYMEYDSLKTVTGDLLWQNEWNISLDWYSFHCIPLTITKQITSSRYKW